jgi:hypothetical protein
MDKIALRKLIEAGVKRARAPESVEGPDSVKDDITGLVLDRLVQAGQLALTYEEPWLFGEVIRGLLEIYRGALHAEEDGSHPNATAGQRLFQIGSRVWIIGADAVRRKRFDLIRELVLQRPVERAESTYWLRYTVTMAARGDTHAFRGKSLIGPVSEGIRERPQFFAAFGSNLDVVVDSLCQFDFLACVLVINETRDLSDVYPNFGGYYSERTIPIIEEVISGGPARTALGDVPNELLAEILRKLDRSTSQAFFGVNGWHGYNERIRTFIANHRSDTDSMRV